MTTKEQVWLAEYIKCRFNAVEAARRAGYKWPEKQGSQIKARLNDEIQAYLREHALSPDEAIYLLSEHATGSHADFAEVNLREDLRNHPKAHLVKAIVTDVYGDAKGRVHHKMRLELYDAQAAVRDILRFHERIDWKKTLPDGYNPDEVQQQFLQLMLEAANAANKQNDS